MLFMYTSVVSTSKTVIKKGQATRSRDFNSHVEQSLIVAISNEQPFPTRVYYILDFTEVSSPDYMSVHCTVRQLLSKDVAQLGMPPGRHE